jgi:hypothetical protein
MGGSDIGRNLLFDWQGATQILSVNGGPVALSWNKEQSDAARNSKDRTIIRQSSVTDVIPQQTCDNACDQSQKSDDCALPADGIRAGSSGTKPEASALPTDRNILKPAQTTALALAFWRSPLPAPIASAMRRNGARSSHRQRRVSGLQVLDA